MIIFFRMLYIVVCILQTHRVTETASDSECDPLKTVSGTSNPDQSKSTSGRLDQILDKETCKEDVNMLINLDGGTKE